jgi:hypothetical protein
MIKRTLGNLFYHWPEKLVSIALSLMITITIFVTLAQAARDVVDVFRLPPGQPRRGEFVDPEMDDGGGGGRYSDVGAIDAQHGAAPFRELPAHRLRCGRADLLRSDPADQRRPDIGDEERLQSDEAAGEGAHRTVFRHRALEGGEVDVGTDHLRDRGAQPRSRERKRRDGEDACVHRSVRGRLSQIDDDGCIAEEEFAADETLFRVIVETVRRRGRDSELHFAHSALRRGRARHQT